MNHFHLFIRPSFSRGMASIMDIGATLNEYNTDETPEVADEKALVSDWKETGNDISFAVKTYGKKQEK